MQPPKFHVGQAVVCVNVTNCIVEGAPLIRLGAIYFVRHLDQGEGIWLVALAEFPATEKGSWGWPEAHFAPVELLPDEALAELKECLEPAYA